MHQVIHLPYAEYWVPLLIGMTVGWGAIVVSKIVFRKPTSVSPSSARANQSGSADDLLVQCSPSEQRRTLRRDGNPTEIYVAPPGYKDRPTRGFVADRSLGGLCLHLTQEVRPGAILSILPVGAPQMTHWVEIEVKSCRPTSEGWEVGCSFVKTPPYTILMMFG